MSEDLRRVVETPRTNWKRKVVSDGLSYYNLDGIRWSQDTECNTYWNEEGSVQISLKAEKEIIEATFELHNMCLEAVDKVVNDDDLLKKFEIPEVLWPAIKTSWKNKKTDFMGRFDLAWGGEGKPKMLEYNADTPSVLVESAQA